MSHNTPRAPANSQPPDLAGWSPTNGPDVHGLHVGLQGQGDRAPAAPRRDRPTNVLCKLRLGGVSPRPSQRLRAAHHRRLNTSPRDSQYHSSSTESGIHGADERRRGLRPQMHGAGSHGDVLRASGVSYDVRSANPYYVYKELNFTPRRRPAETTRPVLVRMMR